MMQRRWSPIWVLIVWLFAWLPVTADPAFIAGIDDLPLMPGLREEPQSAVVFDKPDGRIVEAYASGRGLDRRRVIEFYRATLPQLGWTAAGELAFVRENEELRLTITSEGSKLLLRFDIAPR